MGGEGRELEAFCGGMVAWGVGVDIMEGTTRVGSTVRSINAIWFSGGKGQVVGGGAHARGLGERSLRASQNKRNRT